MEDNSEATLSIPSQFALFVDNCSSAAATFSSSVRSSLISATMMPLEDIKEADPVAIDPPNVTVKLSNT